MGRVDSSHAGRTGGDLGGPQVPADWDGYLARYDSAGHTNSGSSQYGTKQRMTWAKTTTDGAGGAIVAGITGGNLGGTNAGGADGFVLRYDSAGNQLWKRQFGSTADDLLEAITTDDAGGAYIGGRTIWQYLNGTNRRRSRCLPRPL